ncbi:SAM-dependent methyltransferase [Bacillus sp. AFS002410]|uniref:class I SAM-dependent methyltransferase n=1 Tax=Bacillus sp. AFS002410 TaxID=2033481 RepID=UPI000BEFD102|nr:methyltransferase domain-containing protein [Bacillus sp. AFS002410]PEJ57530.1 SAM-dependent methyltransferase [Bacillus sp. AFS002410]
MADKEFIKQRVQGQFGKNAEKYVLSEGHANGEDLINAVTFLQPTLEDVVLDIATGGGHVAKTLAPFVKNVTATDITEKMLETTRIHLTEKGIQNVTYVLADAEELPFLKNSFDIVTCRIAPHHFPNPDAFIREVSRVLRPNGRFLLIDNIVPNDKTLSDFINLAEAIRDPSHVKCLTKDQWRTLFKEHGLKVEQDILRKKKHPFNSWLDRMAPTEAHKLAVTSMLLQAPENIQSYFNIIIEDETIISFETDQWSALATKQ